MVAPVAVRLFDSALEIRFFAILLLLMGSKTQEDWPESIVLSKKSNPLFLLSSSMQIVTNVTIKSVCFQRSVAPDPLTYECGQSSNCWQNEAEGPRAMGQLDDREVRHERLKFQLRLKGRSLASIARQLGVSVSTVSLVSKGKNRSVRIERALAEALASTPEQLFPDRYPQQQGGQPK